MRNRWGVILCATVVCSALLFLVFARPAKAIPMYARKHNTQCGTCHVLPPKLNQTGEEFLANGYRFSDKDSPAKAFPASVWASFRGEFNRARDTARGLPNRVEIISGGPIKKSRAFYFLEWLPVSQQVGSGNTRVQRHGRFEDIFVSLPVGPAFVTVGQFRQMTQVDVSRRLSLSEPLAFSAGLAGEAALTSRLTGLRSFSLSGRSPAVRVSHQWRRGNSVADGWYNSVTLPFTGELVIPLNSTVYHTQGFAFEFRPKGALIESYYRKGLNTFGGHVFAGDGRSQFGLVGALNHKSFFSTLAWGYADQRSGADSYRVSWENEWVPLRWMAAGLRLDDETGTNRPAALIPYLNFAVPLTTYMVRFTAEHRQQRANRQWLLELGLVF